MFGQTSRMILRGAAGQLKACGKVYNDQIHIMGTVMLARSLSSMKLTKNLELITNTPRPLPAKVNQSDPKLRLALERPDGGSLASVDDQRPLCVIMSWLMAKRKHIMKYAQFYLDQGFDVLSVSCSPYQLLFPERGGILIARDVLAFMTNNRQYSATTLHGFSIGGFIWGQVMAMMSADEDKYGRVVDQIVGQIWDSPVDVEGLSSGMGTALFPNNKLLKHLVEGYAKFHVNTFQESATQHYLQSSVFFHNTILKCPTLFFCSEDDPVAYYYIVERAAERMERKGLRVFMKVWKSSPHVSHMWRHPQEYQAEMKAFLDTIGLLKYPEKFQVKAAAKS